MITATLEDIRPRYNPQHPFSERRVQAILDHLRITDQDDETSYRDWDLPPVVVIEDESNGAYTVLDGHHRMEAARRLAQQLSDLETIPAWVVTVADYCRLVEEQFDGISPSRICELREHILCGDVTANEVAEHGEDVFA